MKRKNLIRKPEEIEKTNIEGLEEIYEKVHTCEKCGIKYGSDLKKEKAPFLCPFCDERMKRFGKKS